MSKFYDSNDFPEDIKESFFEAFGIDYGNNSVIPVDVSFLATEFEHHNIVVVYLTETLDIPLNSSIEVLQQW